ncbi:hypothetical protein AUJ83_04170 [Candidatus Woesearchaeota archaeon CG1_02_33_12]|nr:MAG: hypothetical protein AUJ83_04170 [Candidatus Woesearchaeota archaeon CG1_02_33_12]PIN78398.1 MAG: hypothetical protein COV14_03780 [Candidatus Woesearchaeota archaeon CG10_big_fil_rev_8_21_14_0_10_33_12]PIU72447.1 MAG: hypothetical protein COS79_02915 [Candidatus Woesearchaeota archaeon CG06_land_8_20_14_3_00_33_13]
MKEKRVLVASFILIIIGLFFILNFEGNITGAAIGIQKAMDLSSNFLFGFFLVWLAGILLIGGADVSLEERVIETKKLNKGSEVKNDLTYNLNYILNKGIELDDLVAVRVIENGNLNKKGDNFYAGPYRPTLHFTLNHFVKSHSAGDWKNSDTAILTPLKTLIKNNPDRFYGGPANDLFCVGYAKLPDYEIVKREGLNDEDFVKKINKKIEDMGFKILPDGSGNWGAPIPNTDIKFKDFLESLGDYYVEGHTDSAFGETEDAALGNLFFDLSMDDKGNLLPVLNPKNLDQNRLKTNLNRYMSRITEDLGIEDIIKKDKEGKVTYPELNEFYRNIKERLGEKNFDNYEEWIMKNIKGNDVFKDKEGYKYNLNLDFYRTLYMDGVESITKNRISNLEDNLKGAKWHHKLDPLSKPAEKYADLSKVKEAEEELTKVKSYLTRFSGPIDAWKAHWREKEKGNKDYKN